VEAGEDFVHVIATKMLHDLTIYFTGCPPVHREAVGLLPVKYGKPTFTWRHDRMPFNRDFPDRLWPIPARRGRWPSDGSIAYREIGKHIFCSIAAGPDRLQAMLDPKAACFEAFIADPVRPAPSPMASRKPFVHAVDRGLTIHQSCFSSGKSGLRGQP